MADLSVVVHGGGSARSAIMPPPQTLNVALLQGERIFVRANTVSHILGVTGEVAFVAAPGHSATTNYTARLRVSGNSTIVDTQDLGNPTPDGNNVIIADLTALFTGQSAGNYTVSVFAEDSQGGSFDSAESAPFALPLA